MNISRPFILRPVATTLLMAAVLATGALAYRLLPVSALPQVDYPTMQVVTFYPGASPSVTASAITAYCMASDALMPVGSRSGRSAAMRGKPARTDTRR